MHIINLKNSDTHRTEDRVVDGAFCSSTDDGSESRCDWDVTVDTVGDVTIEIQIDREIDR